MILYYSYARISAGKLQTRSQIVPTCCGLSGADSGWITGKYASANADGTVLSTAANALGVTGSAGGRSCSASWP